LITGCSSALSSLKFADPKLSIPVSPEATEFGGEFV